MVGTWPRMVSLQRAAGVGALRAGSCGAVPTGVCAARPGTASDVPRRSVSGPLVITGA